MAEKSLPPDLSVQDGQDVSHHPEGVVKIWRYLSKNWGGEGDRVGDPQQPVSMPAPKQTKEGLHSPCLQVKVASESGSAPGCYHNADSTVRS